MNRDHDFAQVCKFSEEQRKKMQMKHFFSPIFFSRIQVKTKKKKNRALFPPNFRSDVLPVPIKNIGGDADADHSQTIGGDTAKLLGGYIPPSPRVSAPLTTVIKNDIDNQGGRVPSIQFFQPI